MARRRKKRRAPLLLVLAAVLMAVAGYLGFPPEEGAGPAVTPPVAALPSRGPEAADTPEPVASGEPDVTGTPEAPAEPDRAAWYYGLDVPAYSGEPYAEVNDNVPFFTEGDQTVTAFEEYSELDQLGRCGVAYANVCRELMPTEPREGIGMIKPTGWHTVRYDDLISDKYLYNRCHLIGFQLAGENANEKNLITGTRYMNVEGMLPFENQVADYVDQTGNHVLYRVTPLFVEEELVAGGVLMEALSVEDGGEGVRFCVYVYNVQPGIRIDYATGESEREET